MKARRITFTFIACSFVAGLSQACAANVDAAPVKQELIAALSSLGSQKVFWRVNRRRNPIPGTEEHIEKEIAIELRKLPAVGADNKRRQLEKHREERIKLETKPIQNPFTLYLEYVDVEHYYAQQVFKNGSRFDYYGNGANSLLISDETSLADVILQPAATLEALALGNPMTLIQRFLLTPESVLSVEEQTATTLKVRLSLEEEDTEVVADLLLPSLQVASLHAFRNGRLTCSLVAQYESQREILPSKVEVHRYVNFMKEPLFTDEWELVSRAPMGPSSRIETPPIPKDYTVKIPSAGGVQNFKRE